jgi:hypothetical protein
MNCGPHPWKPEALLSSSKPIVVFLDTVVEEFPAQQHRTALVARAISSKREFDMIERAVQFSIEHSNPDRRPAHATIYVFTDGKWIGLKLLDAIEWQL